MRSRDPYRVAVIGGGVAGLAAACALAQDGYGVELFERRPYVGGRASSYLHPGVDEVIDNCQHIILGCCTNVLGLLRRAGQRMRCAGPTASPFSSREAGGQS